MTNEDDTGGEVDFHACNSTNSSSEQASLLTGQWTKEGITEEEPGHGFFHLLHGAECGPGWHSLDAPDCRTEVKGRGYRSPMAYYPERMSNVASTSSLICLGSVRDPLVADQ
jgi:hypothetical protein